MQNVVLTIHLILALLLTGVVLLQRSEGGGLGMGGGGGGAGGVMSGRQAANAMTRLTWIFGIGLFVTSLTLTVIAARESSSGSIIDQLGMTAPAESSTDGSTSIPGVTDYTAPPAASGQPVTPPAPDAPATPPAVAPAAETSAPAAAGDVMAPPAPDAPAPDAAAPDATSEPAAEPAGTTAPTGN